MRLDIGELPDTENLTSDTDPDRAIRLTAHAVARIADRLPFSRKISRHMEGQENRAGIISDLLSLAAELARRNPDIIESRLQSFGDDLQRVRRQRAEHAAFQQAANQTQPEGNTHAA